MATEPMSTLTMAGTTYEITDAKARASAQAANESIKQNNQQITENDKEIAAMQKTLQQIQASAITAADALNIAYPVGAVCITSTNKNPGSTIGGTWTLIDKQYKSQSIQSGVFTPNSDVISAVAAQAARMAGDSVQIRLQLTNAVEFADASLLLGQINLAAIGITESWITYFVGYCDGGNAIMMCDASNTGELDCHDVIGKTSNTIAAGNGGIRLEWNYYVSWANRMDSFCDKFYWKRTK